ncbi:eukaryotic glutathione synthase, ATP binding domain-containing protein [Phthorimaea operculella]|nr:eukaryotic glutathione synthase, ATP binding domain-containing protein [Phthorimaea operculella]
MLRCLQVANDEEFLRSALQNCLQDDIIANFWSIWNTVRDEGVAQSVSLGVFRSDYLLDTRANNRIKHVEINHKINTHAAGGAALAPVPENHALSGFCAGIITAHDLFAVPNAVVVFVVPNPKEYGQRAIESNITDKRPDIQRRPSGVRGTFLLGLRLATPTSDIARLGGETQNRALHCPPIQYYLAGTKKVQQALAEPGVLEKFLSDPDKISRVRDTLAGLNSLDFDDSGERAVQMALDDPNRFVLKSEGEGGGNNVFGAELKEVLTKMKHSRERAEHILMERILSPTVPGYIVSPDASVSPLTDLVAELGIYGVMISTERMISNQASGYLVRTKRAQDDEVGIMQGIGAFDTPFLFD